MAYARPEVLSRRHEQISLSRSNLTFHISQILASRSLKQCHNPSQGFESAGCAFLQPENTLLRRFVLMLWGVVVT